MASPTPTFAFAAFDIQGLFGWLIQFIFTVFVIVVLFGVANALKAQILRAV